MQRPEKNKQRRKAAFQNKQFRLNVKKQAFVIKRHKNSRRNIRGFTDLVSIFLARWRSAGRRRRRTGLLRGGTASWLIKIGVDCNAERFLCFSTVHFLLLVF